MPFERELTAATEAASQAAAEVRVFYRGSFEVQEKGHGKPVTEADLRANEVLRRVLLSEFPAYRWLSEESAQDARAYGEEPTWVIDPLDGTAEFIEGLPEFAVSVALVSEGRARSWTCRRSRSSSPDRSTATETSRGSRPGSACPPSGASPTSSVSWRRARARPCSP